MRVAIIHSQQPANQYTGGGAGVADSERAWMRKLALQLVPLLRAAGVDAIGPAHLGASYADNVRWVNAQTGVDVLVSLHSNAMGNACILYGTSAKSRAYAAAFQRELNAANLLPFGDRWEFNERKVSEVADTNPPAVLLEVGQHDRADYAQWLRDGINSGTYARKLTAPILRALGVTTLTLPPKPSPPQTSSAPFQEDIMATTDELRAIIREELRALLTEPTGMDWSRPAQGDSILSAVQGVLHMRDVPATLTPETEESPRLDVRVRAIEDKLDRLLAQRDGLRDAMGV